MGMIDQHDPAALRKALNDLIEAGDDVEFVGIWESSAVDRFVVALQQAKEAGSAPRGSVVTGPESPIHGPLSGGGSGVAGPSLDLDALREKAENADGHVVLLTADSLLAVLALVDEQRQENERLREALRRLASMKGFEDAGYAGGDTFPERELRARGLYAERALAGSPAEKEQP